MCGRRWSVVLGVHSQVRIGAVQCDAIGLLKCVCRLESLLAAWKVLVGCLSRGCVFVVWWGVQAVLRALLVFRVVDDFP